MKSLLSALFFFCCAVASAQQDTIYTISNWGGNGIRQITNVDPNNGSGAAAPVAFATSDYTTASAALAIGSNGYLYYIQQVPNNEGGFAINAIAAYPTATVGTEPVSQVALDNLDINGALTTNASFRSMAASPNGWIYLTATDDGSGVVHLARFLPGPGGSASNFESLGTVSLSGTTGENFRNGDMAFDGKGDLFTLISQDNAAGRAVIFHVAAAGISTSSSGVTTLQPRYDVVDPGGNYFSGFVVGFAAASSGNFYVAVQDAGVGGIYFLSKSTTNASQIVITGPIATANAADIADLATGYFPLNTVLPVSYGAIRAKVMDQSLVLDWTTLSEKNNAGFEIEVSKDGTHFTKIGTVATKAVNGNADSATQYHFVKTIEGGIAVMGISLFSLAFVLLLVNRRNRLLLSLMMVVGLGVTFTSCSKSADQVDIGYEGKLFVRIVQVDIDGKRSISDVVTAYKAD